MESQLSHPIQSNPLMGPIHVELCVFDRATSSSCNSATYPCVLTVNGDDASPRDCIIVQD